MSAFTAIFYERFAQVGSVVLHKFICCKKKLSAWKGEKQMVIPAPERNASYCAHTDATMCFETVNLPALCGGITAMYPIYDQCLVQLCGCEGTDEQGCFVWL